ncbi:MAG: triose-phosphate isomerase [Anaerolineae bacterium]|nr:triose-phosphate isomerase [Anaerolineae bacterium]
MRKKFIAGNWKMNKTLVETRLLLNELGPLLNPIDGVDRAVCPPYSALQLAAEMLRGTNIKVGAQNMHWEESGAFTGELSPAMIAEVCHYVIVGHSERRQYFGETDKFVNKKIKAALAHGITPIMCVGESLEENQAGLTSDIVSQQVLHGLAELSPEQGSKIVVAYEPIWAIGTGLAATPDDANKIHRNVVRAALIELFGMETAQKIQILYGGSVKPENAAGFFAQSDIDGALVGGASLNAEVFADIARIAAS